MYFSLQKQLSTLILKLILINIILRNSLYFSALSSPKKHKKSKKHKHHKKKKQPPEADLSATPPIKLKFKIGGQMVGTKRSVKSFLHYWNSFQ